jgi:hypothetical protein
MLRKKFSPPPAPAQPQAGHLFVRDQQPLPVATFTVAALRYHFALQLLHDGLGQLEHFVLLAQHLEVARTLGNLGCQRITQSVVDAADRAIVEGTKAGLMSGIYAVESAPYGDIKAFLLEHDQQLQAASNAAVSVALADLNAARAPVSG